MSDTRNKIIDDLQDAAHPEQAEHTPVLLWGRLADWVIADRQKLLDELLADLPEKKPTTRDNRPGRTNRIVAWFEGYDTANDEVRVIIEKKRGEL